MRSFDEVWKLIVKHKVFDFKTKTGKPFKYSLEGMVLIINSPTTIYYYTSKRSFEIAFEIGKCSGPGGYAKERIGGASYVWAILHDKRINAFA